MTRLTLSLLLTLALSASALAQTQKAIRFGRLWDGTRVVADAVVIVEGDRIVSVSSGTRPAAGRRGHRPSPLHRASPGLIDVHTHMTYYWDRTPGTRPLGQRRRPAVTVFLAQDNARAHARNRRDDGSRSRRVERDRLRDARSDQHGRDGRAADVRRRARASRPARGGRPESRRHARQARRSASRPASDWIKVFGSRGSFQSVDTTQTVTFDEMKAIVDAAHAQGRKVAIHSYGPSGVKDAVRAGADSVEHGIDLDDETIAEMAKRGTVWVPTIDHNRYYVDAKDEYGFAPEAIPPLQDYIEKNLESARRAVKAGVQARRWAPTRSTRCSARTRASSAGSSRPG